MKLHGICRKQKKRYGIKVYAGTLLVIPLSLFSGNCLAIDSYRYLHVTIETPWLIFLFLLPAVLAPLILMAVLYWRFAGRKKDHLEEDKGHDD